MPLELSCFVLLETKTTLSHLVSHCFILRPFSLGSLSEGNGEERKALESSSFRDMKQTGTQGPPWKSQEPETIV